MRGMMNKYLLQALLAMVLVFISTLGFSEDIELYVSDEAKSAAKKTKVLLVFDTSGSMGWYHTVSASYDPSQTYLMVNAEHDYKNGTLYYKKKAGEIASDHNDPRQFLAAINSCEASKTILAEEGFYSARIREYTYKGQTGSWEELRDDNSANGIKMVECEEDAYVADSKGNIANAGSTVNASPLAAGYPVNEQGTKTDPKPHNVAQTSTNVNWSSGTFVTLYTGKYLRWYHKQNVPDVNETRLETAKKSMRSFIRSTPSIDFGLEIFNSSGKGGRVVLGIPKETTDNHAALLALIKDELVSGGNTPLCESAYEGSQYFAGKAVNFGNQGGNATPLKDTSIEVGGKYKRAFDDCASNIAHMILITDGEPTSDNQADALIQAMTTRVQKFEADGTTPVYDAAGQPVYVDKQFVGSPFQGNYLAALAGWISTYDINPDISGMQTVVTHTIGFGSGAAGAKALLEEAALKGKGKFFEAQNGSALTQALISIVNDLPQASDSLTSGSVAVNNLDRTQTLDSAYFAMFNSQSGPRWQGNLKKYKVVGKKIADANDADAICENNGTSSICSDAQSYWSTTTDGNVVSKGGVVEWFNKTEPAQRVLYINESTSSLVTFNKTNLVTIFGNETELANELGVAALVPNTGSVGKAIFDAAINNMIGWARGFDVDAESGLITEMRKDVFGDPLHSKPIAINYGMNNNGMNDIRIVVGTNAGALHMFKDSGNTVEESWAFMPKEFISDIKDLRENLSSSNKIYGVDGEITLHVNDKNGNGVIEKGVDTAWIFFGLRRGGSSYYGVNVSDPNSPKLMWHIDNATAGFTTLGQSWSQPKVGYSPLNVVGGVASPVLFIGGGYNTNKDSTGPATPDGEKGVGIYMIDASTGTLLWSALPTGGDTLFPGVDGIASRIGTLDSTGDGLVDRLYTGDTGGNIWRVDMPGKLKSGFSVFKLASLGGGADDQRFFYEPAIARTYILETLQTDVTQGGSTTSVTHTQETPYDAIIIGSGDRTNPVGSDTADTLYMIKDSNIITQKFPSTTTPVIPVPTTIAKADLYNYTKNPFASKLKDNATATEKATEDKRLADLRLAVSQKSGWYIDLSQSGEKTSAAGLVIQGSAYFTTYTPASDTSIINCKPPEGTGSLYVVDLALGIKKHNIKEGIRTSDDRAVKIGKNWLGTPTIVVTVDPNGIKNTIIMVEKVNVDVNEVFKTTRTYLYRTENQ
jgi:type IV pilus assembly protein PilY1